MSTEDNNQASDVDTSNNEGEGEHQETADEKITLTKAEYDKIQKDLGSLKRENKDLKKPKEPKEDTPEKNQDVSSLQERLDRQALKAASITHEDDIELAKKTAEKWNMSIDEVIEDEDFKAKLDRQQTNRANVEATAGIKGDKSQGGSAKETSAYWNAKGQPPTPEDIPNRKTRQKIIREMRQASTGGGKTFYND